MKKIMICIGCTLMLSMSAMEKQDLKTPDRAPSPNDNDGKTSSLMVSSLPNNLLLGSEGVMVSDAPSASSDKKGHDKEMPESDAQSR